MPKAVFFSPHSFVWLHAFPESLIAEALKKEGMDVHMVGCNRDLVSQCISMDTESVSETATVIEKEKICQSCLKNKTLIRKHFPFEYSDISNYLDQEDKIKVERDLAAITPQNILEFQIDGINVGRDSLYDFTLVHKKLATSNFTDEEWQSFLKRFRSVLTSFYAGKKIIEKLKPDYMFFYSSSYSCNLAVREQADRQKIRTFSIYAGNNWDNRIQQMHISNIDSFLAMELRNKLWEKKYSDRPAAKKDIDAVGRFSEALFHGKSIMVYGGGKRRFDWYQLRENLGVSENQRLLLLATSSYDELLSGQMIGAYPEASKLCFPTQLDWIKETIEFVSKRPDLHLVIRVHPRELPNRREKYKSEHAFILEGILKGKLPSNVSVNWPQDGLSLYNFLNVLDLGLTSWSSVGKELACWGLPNLTYAKDICTYPAEDLGWTASSKEEYFKNIDLALKEGFSTQRIIKAYRWHAFELNGALFDLSDVIPSSLNRPPAFWKRAMRKYVDSKFIEKTLLFRHREPLKQSRLIYDRVTSGKPSEDALEETRIRLSTEGEQAAIHRVVESSARILWGTKWRKNTSMSPTQKNILSFLEKF